MFIIWGFFFWMEHHFFLWNAILRDWFGFWHLVMVHGFGSWLVGSPLCIVGYEDCVCISANIWPYVEPHSEILQLVKLSPFSASEFGNFILLLWKKGCLSAKVCLNCRWTSMNVFVFVFLLRHWCAVLSLSVLLQTDLSCDYPWCDFVTKSEAKLYSHVKFGKLWWG